MNPEQPSPSGTPRLEPAPRRPARGTHDVVIESPEHVTSILAVDAEDWRNVWELCRQRLSDLSDRAEIVWSTLFKNSGAGAGASLEHVHSQIVALDFVPPAIRAELDAVAAAHDPFGTLVRQAAADERIVDTAGDLVALVPPAPRQPYETWILPRVAEPYFHTTGTGRVGSLASLTRSIIGRLDRLVPGADYNWWLHQPPYRRAAMPPASWHWHLEVLPRVTGLAGFELGTGCHVTPVGPRDSARRLRGD